MAAADVIRRRVVSDILKVQTVKKCWPTWRSQISALAGDPPTAKGLIQEVGTKLESVFQSTNDGRNQSSQSGGGYAWEALVCWYLNLCLIGTRAVVVKKPLHLPVPLREALTVMYGNVQTNTESDLVAIVFPKDANLDSFDRNYSGKSKEGFDAHLGLLLSQVEACVIQCKTNWNENAQIPMLWDMIYSATGFQSSRASVGVNGRSVHDLKHFAYALVTVPTQKDKSKFTSTCLPVLRLRNLSGGNYWGMPAKAGVAGAMADMFGRVFSTATQGVGQPWRNHLDAELKLLGSKYRYFDL